MAARTRARGVVLAVLPLWAAAAVPRVPYDYHVCVRWALSGGGLPDSEACVPPRGVRGRR